MEKIAPTADYVLAFCEMVVGLLRSVMREARGTGTERFILAGVFFNVELGMINEEEETVGLYAPFRWRGRKADLVMGKTQGNVRDKLVCCVASI